MNLREAIEVLRKSPLFNLSISSKELFHSNFLYWLWQIQPEMFKMVMQELGADTSTWGENYEVYRERDNWDLSVWVDKQCLFILENKVKSIPRCAQLDGYYQEGRSHMLLSLITEFPEKDKMKEKWVIKNYEDLAQAIEGEFTIEDEYHARIVKDYCTFIKGLHALCRSWQVDVQSCYRLIDSDKDISQLRMADLREKLRNAQIVGVLGEKLDEMFDRKLTFGKKIEEIDGCIPGEDIFTNFGLTRSQGFIEVKVKINSAFVLLVQIQGKQYRHGIEWREKGSYSDAVWWDKTKDILAQSGFFSFNEDRSAKYPACIGKQTEQSKEYCKYGDRFLYQYINLGEQSVQEVINAICEDVKAMFKIADDLVL